MIQGETMHLCSVSRQWVGCQVLITKQSIIYLPPIYDHRSYDDTLWGETMHLYSVARQCVGCLLLISDDIDTDIDNWWHCRWYWLTVGKKGAHKALPDILPYTLLNNLTNTLPNPSSNTLTNKLTNSLTNTLPTTLTSAINRPWQRKERIWGFTISVLFANCHWQNCWIYLTGE